MSNRGWIAVDLDGTLAEYHGWVDANHVGQPIPKMLERVKTWLAEGQTVKIFTARASGLDHPQGSPNYNAAIISVRAIEAWCLEHIGQHVEVTNKKDYAMIQLWDDRAIQVIENTGVRADGKI